MNWQSLDADVADASGSFAADADAGEEGSPNVQFVITTSSVVMAGFMPICEAASAPRPELREMQSSPVSMSQPSMTTCLQESTSMPSPLPPMLRMVRFFKVIFSQRVG